MKVATAKLKLNIQYVSIGKIKPAKYNPRKTLKPGDSGYEKLSQSIEYFSLVEPLVWNKRSGNLISGHIRYAILKRRGHTEIPVSVQDLDEKREKALNITLNSQAGEWDVEKLQRNIAEIREVDPDFQVEILGFSLAEVDHLEIDKENQANEDFTSQIETFASDSTQEEGEEAEDNSIPSTYDREKFRGFNCLFSVEQHDVFLEAIAKAKKDFGLETSPEALYHIALHYLGKGKKPNVNRSKARGSRK